MWLAPNAINKYQVFKRSLDISLKNEIIALVTNVSLEDLFFLFETKTMQSAIDMTTLQWLSLQLSLSIGGMSKSTWDSTLIHRIVTYAIFR